MALALAIVGIALGLFVVLDAMFRWGLLRKLWRATAAPGTVESMGQAAAGAFVIVAAIVLVLVDLTSGASTTATASAPTRSTAATKSTPKTSPTPTPTHTEEPPLQVVSAGGLSLVDRIRTPLERKEVGDDDCAKSKGCPALTPNPAHQPASYGWTQLTVDTLLEELASSRGIPDCVGLTDDDVKKAKERSRQAANWFNNIDDEQDPDRMPADFPKQTGLSADDYRAIVYWKRLEDVVDDYSPSHDPDGTLQKIRSKVDPLLQKVNMSVVDMRPYVRVVIWNEAKQGFATKAALAGGDMRAKLIRLFSTKSCYDEIADRMINVKVIANQARYPIAASLTEDEYASVVASLVAYHHNVGHVYGTKQTEKGDPQFLPRPKSRTFTTGLYCFGYVRDFFQLLTAQAPSCS